MRYLLDTDTCIYWLNGKNSVIEKVLEVGLSEVAICTITIAELYFGAYNSSRIETNLPRAEQFIQTITILPLNVNILKCYGQLKAELRQIGRPIEDFDLLIASVALYENLILVTNNTRHYSRIGELRLDNWAN